MGTKCTKALLPGCMYLLLSCMLQLTSQQTSSSGLSTQECTIDNSPGIQSVGLFPSDFWASFNYSKASSFPSNGSQGLPASSSKECNCRCASTFPCIGYVWLGSEDKSCWMLSEVDSRILGPTYESADKTATDVAKDAVYARVTFAPGQTTYFCGLINLSGGQRPAMISSEGITRGPIDSDNPWNCNAECLLDPKCVGFLQDYNETELIRCYLLSSVRGDLKPATGNWYTLQTCSEKEDYQITPGAPYAAVISPPSDERPLRPKISDGDFGLIPAGYNMCIAYQDVAENDTATLDQCSADSTVLRFKTDDGTWYRIQPAANTSLCLGIQGSSDALYTPATWEGCAGGRLDQQFTILKSQDNPLAYRLVPRHAQYRVLQVEEARYRTGVPLQLFSDNQASYQTFNVTLVDPPPPAPQPTPGADVSVVNNGSGSGAAAVPIGSPAINPPSPNTKKTSLGLIVGVTVAGVLGVAVLLAAIMYVYKKRRQQTQTPPSPVALQKSGTAVYQIEDTAPAAAAAAPTKDEPARMLNTSNAGLASIPSAQASAALLQPMTIPGLNTGEVFTRATAHAYSWLDTLPVATPHVPLSSANDFKYDQALPKDRRKRQPAGRHAFIEMTQQDLQRNIIIVKDGLLGKGGSAVTFKCLWPNRFGTSAVLAVKMLKDGYEAQPEMLQSFWHEANILKNTEHPHVVRAYGACLEPPTVCIIMELLPYSLNDVLYDSHLGLTLPPHAAATSTSANSSSLISTGNSRSTSSSVTWGDDTGGGSAKQGLLPPPGGTPGNDEDDSSAHRSSNSVGSGAIPEDVLNLITRFQQSNTLRYTDDRVINTTTTMMAVAGDSDSSRVPAFVRQLQSPGLRFRAAIRIIRDVCSGLEYLHNKTVDMDLKAFTTMHTVTIIVEEPGSDQPSESCDDTARLVKDGNSSVSQTATVVHRDLKPANVLMTAEGVPKICDFGLAREQQSSTIITHNLAAGTLAYMAPEVISGRVNTLSLGASNKVDIYSLGLMFWELLTCERPWSGMAEVNVISAVVLGHRPRIDAVQSCIASDPHLAGSPATLAIVKEEVARVLRAMWHKKDHKRPDASTTGVWLDNVIKMVEGKSNNKA